MPSNPAFSQSSHARSTHSLASTTATSKTVQQQYQEHRVQKKVTAWNFGSGSFPFKLAIGFVVVGFLALATGVGLLAASAEGRLVGLDDKQQFLGPLFVAAGLVCWGVAGWFFFDARRKSTKDKQKLTYKPTGGSGVKVVDRKVRNAQSRENLKSGTCSSHAVGSTPDHSLHTVSVHSSRNSVASHKKSLPSLDGSRSRLASLDGSRSQIPSANENARY